MKGILLLGEGSKGEGLAVKHHVVLMLPGSVVMESVMKGDVGL